MARVKTKSGATLTPRAVERLADEAERGYDLARATPERVGPGRPPLSAGSDGESPRISYRIPASLLESAERQAEEEGRTLSSLARDALERYVREHGA